VALAALALAAFVAGFQDPTLLSVAVAAAVAVVAVAAVARPSLAFSAAGG